MELSHSFPSRLTLDAFNNPNLKLLFPYRLRPNRRNNLWCRNAPVDRSLRLVSVKAAREAETETAVVVDQPRVSRFLVSEGHPAPFGATARDGGVNFSIYSSNTVSATLCLIALSDLPENRVTEQISLDLATNKTGDIWHVFLKGDFKDMLYGYKFDGKLAPEEGHYYDSSQIVVDPYAKAVVSRGEFGVLGLDDNCWPQMACMIPAVEDEFDWEGDLPLKYPQKDLVIYEMHVRGFTHHESSKAEFPGTYLGVTEKLDHLKVELLGVFNYQLLFTYDKICLCWNM